MEGYTTAAAGQMRGAMALNQAASNAPKPISQMQMHSVQLQELANRLHGQIVRLSEIIDRFAGPSPPNASDVAKEVTPLGVLVVAQFESRRIAEGLDRLTDQVNRLDQIA